MAIDFLYYLQGANIALVEKEDNTQQYKSPSATITNGLQLEYSKMPTSPTADSSTIDLSEELCLAVVDYLKAKFAENEQQYDKRNFHMAEFKRKVFQYQRNRFGGLRKVEQKEPYAIK